MIIVTVSGQVKPEFKETFLQHMAELAPIVQAEAGCIQYQQHISAEDPNLLFLYEKWQSREHLLAHLDTAHMQEHLAEARPWFDSVEMTTFEAEEMVLFDEAEA